MTDEKNIVPMQEKLNISLPSGNISKLLDKLTNSMPDRDEDYENAFESPIGYKLSLSQGKGKKLGSIPGFPKLKTTGMLFIGKEAPEDGLWVEPVSPEYAAENALKDFEAVVRIILVESMTLNNLDRPDGNPHPKFKRYPLRMLEHDAQDKTVEDPETGQPIDACKSQNGVFPMAQYIGKEIELVGLNKRIKIGYKVDETNGQLYPVDDFVEIDGVQYPDVCGNCPAALFRSSNGKVYNYCNIQPVFVIYVLPFERGDGAKFEGGIAEVFAGNKSMQTSFTGTSKKKNAYGLLKDGRPLNGIDWFFEQALDKKSNQLYVRSTDSLKPVHYSRIVAFVETGKSNQEFVTLADATEQHQLTIDEVLSTGVYDRAILDIQTFRAFPEGRPEYIGEAAVVKPVWLETAENTLGIGAVGEQSIVFHLDEALDMETYTLYISALAEYYGSDSPHWNYRMGLTGEDVMSIMEEAYAKVENTDKLSYPKSGPRRVDTGRHQEEEISDIDV